MTQPSPHTSPKPFTESHYYMWRAVIAVAHADGVVHDKEKELFDKVIHSVARSYALTDEHLGTFTRDLQEAQDIYTLIPHISDPECKALLLFFSQIVASIDGSLAYDEATLVGRLHGKLGSMPDTRERVSEIRANIADRMKQRRADLAANKERDPIYYAVDALLMRLGVETVG